MKERIITGFIGGSLFLALLAVGGIWFAGFICLLAGIAYFEFIKMIKLPFFSASSIFGFIFLGTILYSFIGPLLTNNVAFTFHIESIVVIFGLLMLTLMVLNKNRLSVEKAGALFIGILYISYGFSYFMETRLFNGLETALFILILIWATDSGAYFIGKKYGKHKLWPEISPKKTLEGSLGGIISAVLFSILFQITLGLWDHWIETITLAVIISIIGQMGDLIESAIKRQYQVKDSGTILPGHGGVLDRFDSMLFVFPILHLLQMI